MPADTDADWELLGRMDPYWAVLTNDEFQGMKLGDESSQRFFESGEHYVKLIFQIIHAFVHHEFQPERALDFGCGVGRLVFPLAKRCGAVVGVDVSESMLAEARKIAESMGSANASFVRGDDLLSAVPGDFDLVHSYIVFQHIPCDRGFALFERLLEKLRDGGVGIFHFTYMSDVSERGQRFATVRRCFANFRIALGRWFGWRTMDSPTGPTLPPMQMNCYALNPIFDRLQAAGARRMYVEFTEHGGVQGVLVFFRKQIGETYRT